MTYNPLTFFRIWKEKGLAKALKRDWEHSSFEGFVDNAIVPVTLFSIPIIAILPLHQKEAEKDDIHSSLVESGYVREVQDMEHVNAEIYKFGNKFYTLNPKGGQE